MTEPANTVTNLPASTWSGVERRNQTQPERQKVKFDATINLGHILTFLGFLIAGFGAWTSLDKRVLVLEETKAYQQKLDAQQDQKAVDSINQMKEVMARLDKQIDRLADKLDKKGP